jgi:histidinol-phosphate aminotransferase
MKSNFSSNPTPRSEVVATLPAHHGALDYAELEQLGLAPDSILDFSVNSNPYGPSPLVRHAVMEVPLDRYPDRESLSLRRALAEYWDIPARQFLVGNGTAELLWLVSFTFLQAGDRVLVLGPTFGEYTRTAALMGAQAEFWTAPAESDFEVVPELVERQIGHLQPGLVFLCNPNNPTGFFLSPEIIGGWATAHPHILFVVDEAYQAFAPGAGSALSLGLENILILRSMTKDYALAGLRLGYAVAHNLDIIQALTQARSAWNVNALAQAAGLAALADEAYLRQCLGKLGQAKEDLIRQLASIGLSPVPTTTHFFLVRVGDGARFRLDLLRQGLLVRDCESFGLPAYVRIATRRPEENEQLVTALEQLVKESELVDNEQLKVKNRS